MRHSPPALDRKSILTLITILFFIIALTVLWKWTPLANWIAVDRMVAASRVIRGSPLAPFVVVIVYVGAGLLMMPVTVLIIASIITFGPWLGGFYSLIGCLISGLVTYEIGRHFGKEKVRHIAASLHFEKIQERIAEQGLMTMLLVRLLPIAPFSIVNLASGAARIRLRHFTVGTVLGMAPGILVFAFFSHQLRHAIEHPEFKHFLLLGSIIVLVIFLVDLLRKWAEYRNSFR